MGLFAREQSTFALLSNITLNPFDDLYYVEDHQWVALLNCTLQRRHAYCSWYLQLLSFEERGRRHISYASTRHADLVLRIARDAV